MGGMTPTGDGPGRRPRPLPPGPIKNLIDALDELIVTAYGDGHRSGSRARLIEYVNACEPDRKLTSWALSRQLGDLTRHQWGTDWSYVTLLVTYCVPAPTDQARQGAVAPGFLSAGRVTPSEDDLEATDVTQAQGEALARFAGLWCVARQRSSPPPGYTGPIIWPDGTTYPALTDPEQVEDLTTKLALYQRNYQLMQTELDAAQRRLGDATRERERMRLELLHARDQSLDEATRRGAAETRVAELSQELAELIEEIAQTDQHVAEMRNTLTAQTEQVTRLTALLTDESAARKTAENKLHELNTLRDSARTLQQANDELHKQLGRLRAEADQLHAQVELLERASPSYRSPSTSDGERAESPLYEGRLPAGLPLFYFPIGVLSACLPGAFSVSGTATEAVMKWIFPTLLILWIFIAIIVTIEARRDRIRVTRQALQISRSERHQWGEVDKLTRSAPDRIDVYSKDGYRIGQIKYELIDWKMFTMAVRTAAPQVILEDLWSERSEVAKSPPPLIVLRF